MDIRPIGDGFFECRSDACVGVGASREEAYLNWYMSQLDVVML